MSDARVEFRDDGVLIVSGMPPLLAWSLREMPRLLADDAPGVAERVCATPYPEDEELTKEWHRLNSPDLGHLLRSARQLVVGDLASLRYVDGEGFRVEIPENHRTAWLSALAAARVAQGEAHEVEEGDMERPVDPDLGTKKDRAVLTIHLLGWMQGLLIEGTGDDLPG